MHLVKRATVSKEDWLKIGKLASMQACQCKQDQFSRLATSSMARLNAASFAFEGVLKRGFPNLLVGSWGIKIEQGLDISAHNLPFFFLI